MAVAIRIKRGTKANIESAKATLKQWEQVYATDTDEIGIYDGTNIRWQSSDGELTKSKIDTALKGTGTNSIQLGSGASTLGDYSIALGRNASTSEDNSTALGREATASGYHSTALGSRTSASHYSIAIGHYADASSTSAIALGYNSSAEEYYSTALGYDSYASGTSSTALGRGAAATGTSSIALGNNAEAEGVNSIAIGTETVVTEDNVVDFGSARQVRVNETPVNDRDAVSKKYLEDNKVDKLLTIIGLDLQDNILLGEFKTALGNATQSVAGLLSAEDKTHLDGLVALLETDDDNNVVDTIGEVLAIFENYPEGADLVTALQGKVDKVKDKGLSTNDFTDEYKDKVDNQLVIGDLATQAGRGDHVKTAYDHSQSAHAPSNAQKNSDITKAEIEAKLTGQITSHSHALPAHNHDDRYYTETEVDTKLGGKQDKLTAGDNITIDANNVISASGGEVDMNEMSYFDYASRIYGAKYSLLVSAWEHSFTVDPSEISENSPSTGLKRGKAQYPNGETEGVIIPQGVTSIGEYAFGYWTSNDKPLVIPNSVTSIGDYAFADWNANNQPLVISNSVTSIGNSAFDGWTSNNQPLAIPDSVTSIDNWAFYNWTSNNQPLVIPESVTDIGNSAFRYWTSNNQPLVIPNSITSIGNFAFCNWKSNNQPLVIPDSITSIGEYAFWDWASNNQPLVIPNSVTSIGKGAFSNWQSVPYVEIHATTPPSLANINAFNGQNDAPIYVPDESVDDYKEATQWVDLADRIFPISDMISASGGEVDLSEIEQDILDLQNDKVDKVSGKGLSTNDFTNSDKNKLDGIEAGAEVNEVDSVNGKQGDVVLTQDDINHGATYKRVSQGEKNTWNDKQDKLVAGANITIDENTNVISASGGSGEVDPNELAYFDYAGSIYGAKYNLLANAWESSLVVDPTEISVNSTSSSPRGTAQYPNWATEGVIIPNSVTSIGDFAFYQWYSNNQPLVIPNSVKSVGDYAFYDWSSNNQPLVIPNSITSIGSNAFGSWSANNHPLVIPNSVTSIGEYTFSVWTANNKPLTIPDSVTSIGNYAFAGWTSAKEFIMESETPPTITSNSFNNTNNAPFYVPDENVDDYKTAPKWSDLADRIFPISDKGNTYTKGEIDLMIGDIENALDAILGV